MQKLRQDINLGNNLRNLRNKAGFTQEQVAAKLQLLGSQTNRSTYSRYETGELNIRISDLIFLKEILHCSFEQIFDFSK